jgi:hypothetical protein
MKRNRYLILGIAGMGFFCLMQMVLIFAKAPNITPRALIVGYVSMALLTFYGVIIGVGKQK